MSTSGIDARRGMVRTALVYLLVSLACAGFGAVYELLSHEVYSYCMIYAFLFPLAGGALPYLLLGLFPKVRAPGVCSRLMGHAGIATLTTGSLVRGVLDIYGTTHRLTWVYAPVGLVLAMCFALPLLAGLARPNRP